LPMSVEDGLTLGKLASYILGVILFAMGLMLTYFSVRVESGLVSPRIFTPIGVAIALIGGFMIITREG
jgi:hypothetical protein